MPDLAITSRWTAGRLFEDSCAAGGVRLGQPLCVHWRRTCDMPSIARDRRNARTMRKMGDSPQLRAVGASEARAVPTLWRALTGPTKRPPQPRTAIPANVLEQQADLGIQLGPTFAVLALRDSTPGEASGGAFRILVPRRAGLSVAHRRQRLSGHL